MHPITPQSMNKSIFLTLLFLSILLSLSRISHADEIIGNGASLQINSGDVYDMNCQAMTVSSGGTLTIADGGTLQEVTTLTINGTLDASAVSGSILKLSSWVNNGTVTSIPKTLQFDSLCGAITVAGTSDTDGDGISDDLEGGTDINGDGIPDLDIDSDGIYNFLDLDSDGDGVDDAAEGTADSNTNGIPDYLDNTTAPTFTSPANISLEENLTDIVILTASTSGNVAKTFSVSGGADSSLVTIDPATNQLSFNTAPNYENKVDVDGNNIYEIEVTVTDINGYSTVQSLQITITNINDTPTAAGETLLTTEDTSVSNSISGDVMDEDGDTLSFSLVSDVQHGTLTFDEITGNYTYVPSPQFNGEDRFTYRVTDPSGTEATAEVVLTVIPVEDKPAVFLDTNYGIASTLDWNAQNWVGDRTSTFIVDGVAVTINFGGTTPYVNIADNTNITGGLGAAEQSLGWVIDPTTKAEEGKLVINFDRPVSNVSFNLLDIDSANLNPSAQMEQISVQGLFVGEAANMTLTATDPASVTISANVLESVPGTPVASDADNGNVKVEFAGLVDTVIISYGSQAAAHNNPAWLDFAISDIKFEKAQLDSNVLFVENEPPVLITDPTASVYDMLENDITSLDIVFGGLADGADEVITILGKDFPLDADKTEAINIDGTDVTINYDSSSTTFNITEANGATVPDDVLTKLILSLTYQNLNNTPTEADRTLRVTATDTGGLTSDPALATIIVSAVNDAPVITSDGGGDTASISVDENQTAVSTVTATDYEADSIAYSISGGADAGLFNIDPSTGVLSFVNAPDFEVPSSAAGTNTYEIEVMAKDDGDGTPADTQLLSINVSNVNDAPKITSTDTLSITENVGAIATVVASDEDAGDTLTFSLTGGADKAAFTIDPNTGELSFSPPADYEIATDANADNSYEVEITVTDAAGLSDTLPHTVAVTDINDAPVITSTNLVEMNENVLAVITVLATDQDANDTLTYSLSGGEDKDKFTIDPNTGAIVFNTAPDFEQASDVNGDNTYLLEVTVSDTSAATDTQAITVVISNAQDAPVITSANTADVLENTQAVITVTATDQDVNPADVLVYSLSGGADQAKFAIDASTGELTFVAAPNFEDMQDANTDNIYEVEVSVDDQNGDISTQLISVTVTNVNDAPRFAQAEKEASAKENQTSVLATLADGTISTTVVKASDEDTADTISYSIIGGADMAMFTLDANTGILDFNNAPDFETPNDADTNNIYELEVKAVDGNGGEATQLLHVAVQNVGIQFNVKAILQGAFNGTDMSDKLREMNLIPEQEPYSNIGHTVAEWSKSLNPSLLTVEGNDAIVDWMLLEVRDGTNERNILLSQAVLIQRDGDIVSSDTASKLFSYDGLAAGEYYLSLRHRNHMGVMSDKLSLGATLQQIDFTDPATATWPSVAAGETNNSRLISGNLAVLWAGDANHDGAVISQGSNNDLNILLGSVLGSTGNTEVNSNYALAGYLPSDINMDGKTLFAGAGNDVNLIMGNVLMHSKNTSFSANFIAQEQLPDDIEGVENTNPMTEDIITGWTNNTSNTSGGSDSAGAIN